MSSKGGFPLGAHIDANDEAVGLMYQDYYAKNYDRDKNQKDVDIINNRTFDELNDDEEITQEIQNFRQ